MMMTITTVSLARPPREDIMMTTITITRVSLVRDPRVIMMMTTTIPREARVDTMMTDMVAREVNWGSCAFLIMLNVTPNRCCGGLACTWWLMMALSFVENPTLPLIQSCRQSFCEGLTILAESTSCCWNNICGDNF